MRLSHQIIKSTIMAIAMATLVGGSSAIAAATTLPGGGWWIGQTVQNVGSADADISIQQFDTLMYPSGIWDYNFAFVTKIAPGANKVYDPTSLPMPVGWQGSAIVSSDQDIRAIVSVTNRYWASAGLGDALSPHYAGALYQGTQYPSSTIRFALAKNDSWGKTTTFFIQNAGSAETTATAIFKLNDSGIVKTYTYTTPKIGPGLMVIVVPNDARDAGNNPPPSGNGVVGSLTVTSSQPLAGTVVEHFTNEAHATLIQATRAATLNDYDIELFAPNIKNNYYGRFSGLQVQNVGNNTVNVNVTYVGSDYQSGGTNCIGAIYPDSHNIAPDESWTFPSTAIPDKCYASATILASGNIIGQVNESFTTDYINSTGRYQESTIYSAIPNNSANSRISLPLFKEDSYSKATGATIQNVGGQDTYVILTFKGVAGTFISQPQLIHPGQGLIILDVRLKQANFWNGTAMTPQLLGCVNGVTGCGANGVFSVMIDSNYQNIVATVNESTYPINAPRIQQDKGAYEGINLTTFR
jgi:hypothetical protein